ncbi:hypothetical protein [Catellatospora citrea]|uniref:Uncharacterized protein n=1 Tax=Catellatospora citrea TaxID=53366 RepID=A0A8J3K5G4_9ACTN|nr:hypothetical protein [Catellatospora citrea]RKE05695.1 hypothetical protein C8E86_0505 [Catellatospora citrea]GIF97056.1 hypothetical protein Cci01nite_21500 [Catellatospora citrea]
MTDKHSFRGLLHSATHRLPGVPAHVERPAGHQGTAAHDRARRHSAAPRPSLNQGWNHSPARPARFMRAWQRRIAALFGRERS